MNKTLLLEIADKLERFSETAPDIEFNMNLWGGRTDCGTIACALGTAAIRGWIPGFRYDLGTLCFIDELAGREVKAEFVSSMALEINDEEHLHLFNPNEYDETLITPEMVAARIREFVIKDGRIK